MKVLNICPRGSLNTSEKRQQGHPLKSFSVPAPPPQSAPSTPQQKHIGMSNIYLYIHTYFFSLYCNNYFLFFLVTVRPQGSSSPYKKNNYAAINNSPSSTSVSSCPKTWKSPLTGLTQRDTFSEVDSLSKIQVIKYYFLMYKNIIFNSKHI